MAREGKRELTPLERQEIFNTIIFRSKGDLSHIPRHLGAELAAKYEVTPRCIRQLWQTAKTNGVSKDKLVVDISSRKKSQVGRKLKLTPQRSIPNFWLSPRATARPTVGSPPGFVHIMYCIPSVF